MSHFSETGLTISVNVPLVQGDDHIGTYSETVGNYTHNISANGGFTSASFSFPCNQMLAENWLEYGLGRHVVVYGPSQQIIWEGFVNELTINMGNATFSRGPLTNIANRVLVQYTPYIESCADLLADPDCVDTGEQLTGSTTETTIAEDLDSQERYGVWEKILNIGSVWPAEADYIRDLYLKENSSPEGNPSLSIGSEGDLSVTVNCRGYIDWLTYVYNDEADNQSVIVSESIKTILGDDPNNIISTQYERINENLVIHGSYTSDNKTAKTLIDDILNLGGGTDDRWTFGIYANRKAVYTAIPTEVEYVYQKTNKTQEVMTVAESIIKPWDVVPCKWVAIPTYLASFNYKLNDVRSDPRVFFAEEVSYTAPDQVNISGAKVRKLSHYLAKLGLGGV